jgi:acetyl esterase/lipase
VAAVAHDVQMIPTPPPAIHPELRTLARFLPRGLTPRSLQRVRRLESLQARVAPALGRVVPPSKRRQVEVVSVGTAGARVHRPRPGIASDGPLPAVLWIHGGGYVIGSASQDDALCRHFADELGAVVVSVEYRRAPEHPFPAPLEDCHDVLVWLADLDEVDAGRIAIGGASAGGGLAAGLALMARDRAQVAPVLQLLVYPMLDDRTVLRTDLDQRGYRLWNNASNALGWRSYLGAEPGAADLPDHAVPARAEDLSGLPPAWLGVGTLDLFLDEDLAYAARLEEAGVPCGLTVLDGAFHGFDRLAPRSTPARQLRAAQLDALRAALGTPATT